MSHAPKITAIVCTYNRCDWLKAAIDSLAAQSLSRSQYEVLIVDNASNDRTVDVVTACQLRHPEVRIRLLREDRQGLSYARNTGFQAAFGEYVAYLDDDAMADPQWLESGLEMFTAYDPSPRIVVGPVIPAYPDGKPNWFNDRFETFDLGPDPCTLTPTQSFMGGNAFYDKHALECIGGFDPQFGMAGGRLWLGEEVDLLIRLRQRFGSNCCVCYDPRVRIHHTVLRNKLSVRYVLGRRYLNGLSKCLMTAKSRDFSRLWHGVASSLRIMKSTCLALLAVGRYRSFSAWVTQQGAPIATQLGQLRGCLFLLDSRQGPPIEGHPEKESCETRGEAA